MATVLATIIRHSIYCHWYLAQQLRLRTSNALERVNQELKRRTRVAGLFPNEASLLRLITALLSEISDQWQTTTRVYLTMENHPQPSV
jgi:putative transposase